MADTLNQLLPFILAWVFAVGLGIKVFLDLQAPGIKPAGMSLLIISTWVIANMLEFTAPEVSVKIIWHEWQIILLGSLATTWYIFTAQFTREPEWLRPQIKWILASALALAALLALTNNSHHLLWKPVVQNEGGAFSYLRLSYSFGAVIILGYGLTLVSGSTYLLLKMRSRTRFIFRQQVNALLILTHFPEMIVLIHLLPFHPRPPFYPVPMGILVEMIVCGWLLFGLRVGDIVPVMREAVFDSLSDGVIVLDQESRVLELNKNAQFLIGSESSKVLGQPIHELWEDWPTIIKSFQERSGQNHEIELGQGLRKRKYDVRISNSFNVQGQFANQIVVLHDINELKAAQEALQTARDELEIRVQERTAELEAKEEQYRSVVEQSADCIFLVDLKTRQVLDANPALLQLLGYQAEEIRALTLYQIVAHQEKDIESKIRNIVRRKRYFVGERQYRKKGGGVIPVEVSVSLIHLRGQEIMSVVSRDITARKQAEAEIKSQADRQAAVAELGQLALAGADLQDLMDLACQHVKEILAVDFVGIQILDPAADILRLGAGLGWDPARIGAEVTPVTSNGLAANQALRTREAVVVRNYAEETQYQRPALLADHKINSSLNVVITGQDRPYGVLGIHTHRCRDFNTEDIHFLQAVANVLATTVDHQQAQEDIKQRNRELLTLQSAGAAITSTLDLQGALNTVAQSMANWLGVAGCAISEWDQQDNTLIPMINYGPEGWDEKQAHLSVYALEDYPLTQQVLIDRCPCQLTIDQSELDEAELSYMKSNGLATLLLLPMVFQDRVVGLVKIMDDWAIRKFSEQEVAMGQLLANQAASAIENARLYAKAHQQLAEQMALRNAITVISSTLESQVVLSRIAEQLCQVLNATSAYICDFNPARLTTTVLAEFITDRACPAERRSDLGVTYDLTIDFPDTIKFLARGEPAVDHSDAENLSASEREHMVEFGAKSILSIPLQLGDITLGFAELWESREKRDFKADEVALARDLAQHAAIAIQHARLYEQARQEIQERKTAEKALAEYTRRLEQSNQELQQFAYVASHDLQEPLRMVTSYVQLLARRYRPQLDAEAEEFMDYAVDGARRMQQLIHDLLTYSQIGYSDQPHSLVDTEKVLRTVLRDLRHTTEEAGATINWDSLPTLQADARQLGQLFQNLVGNALKFRGENQPQIEIGATQTDGVWKFFVRDNGIGIEPHHAERIFLIFQRLHTADQYPGTGVGLAICKRIVEQHGGEIWVDSTPGQGSVFYFTIPQPQKVKS